MKPSSKFKIISLNVEGDRHLEIQKAFFKKERADFLCLQEAFRADVDQYCRSMGCASAFAPACIIERRNGVIDEFGVAILSKHNILRSRSEYYRDRGGPLEQFILRKSPQNLMKRALLTIDVALRPGVEATIGTTHFTWSADGKPNEMQFRDVEVLLAMLARREHVMIGGDFNAPRGGALFSRIAEEYADNVPRHYESSIDDERHYAGHLPLMVDGLFSSPRFSALGVRLECGVSDHCAIVGEFVIAEPAGKT